MSTPVWLITAAGSGFGEAVALEALSRGHRVVATGRSVARLEHLRARGAAVMELDVAAPEAELAAAMDRAAALHGGTLTHVLNCAGYLLEGAVEETTQDEVRACYETNVGGVANVSRAAAPHLRAAAAAAGAREGNSSGGGGGGKGGEVVLAHFGSLGSWRSGPAVAVYCSAKAAVTGLVEGLAAELAPFGVSVCDVQPGYFRTAFLNVGKGDGSVHRVRAARSLPVYDGTPARERGDLLDAVDEAQLGDVAKAARVIVDVFTRSGVAEGRDIPRQLVLGSDVVDVIRQKLRETEELLARWEDIARSTVH